MSIAFPGFDTDTVCDVLLPTASFPKLMLAGFSTSCGWDATPTPVNPMTRGEFGALLTIEMLPVALVPEVGENFAVNDVDCPAPRLEGIASPLMLNPGPKTFTCEMEMLADPEFVNVIDDVPLEPTVTLPKVTFEGVAVKLPCTPEPLRGMERVELFALLVIVTFPEAVPVEVGENCMLKLTL